MTPDLLPVSPFNGPGSGALSDSATEQPVSPFSVVETIMGRKRALTAVPRP
jgi:hypothetical protein